MSDPISRPWSTADLVAASIALYGEGKGFSRDDVKNFTRFDEAGDVGSVGQGPRGARLFSEDEVVAIVGLLPWSASLGGVDGRLAWVAKCRQLLRRTPDLDAPLTVEIPPPKLGLSRDPRLPSDRRLDEVGSNAIHLDLRRIRQTVRVALGAKR